MLVQRSHKIIVVLFAFSWPVILQAQKPLQRSKTMQLVVGRKEFEFKQWAHRSSPNYVKNAFFYFGTFYNRLAERKPYSFLKWGAPYIDYSFHLAPRYYIQSLGVVCKNELQLEKITKVAFRIRLGSLEYVNWIEQKPNAHKPQ